MIKWWHRKSVVKRDFDLYWLSELRFSLRDYERACYRKGQEIASFRSENDFEIAFSTRPSEVWTSGWIKNGLRTRCDRSVDERCNFTGCRFRFLYVSTISSNKARRSRLTNPKRWNDVKVTSWQVAFNWWQIGKPASHRNCCLPPYVFNISRRSPLNQNRRSCA